MHTRATAIAAVLFVLIILGMFIYAYLKRTELTEMEAQKPSDDQIVEESPYGYIERIDAKHFFIDGKHTLVGEILMPTPCDLLDPQIIIAESYPEQVTIDFNVINNAEMCTQVITPQRFKVEFTASEEASIRVRLAGREVELNLLQPSEGETPDEFEIFIKG